MNTKLNIVILFFIVLLDQSSFGILLPIFSFLFSGNSQTSFIQQNFSSIHYILYGVFFSIFSIFQFFSATILGELSDYYGRKKIISLSIIFIVLSFILYILGIKSESIILLFLGRIIAGIGAGCLGVIFASASDLSSEHNKTKNFSIIASASGLGLVTGPLLGGIFSDNKISAYFNLYTPLYLFLILNSICLLLFIFLSKETLIKKTSKNISFNISLVHIRKSLQDSKLKHVYLISFLFTCTLSLFIVFGSSFLVNKFNLTLTGINLFLFFFGICIILAQIFLQYIYKKLHKLKIISIFSVVYLFGLFLIRSTDTISLTYVSLFFIAFSIGMLYPTILNIIDENTHQDDKGEKLGINTSIQSLAQAISVLCIGISTYFINIKNVIVIIMLGVLLVLLLSVSLYKKKTVLA